MIDRDRRCGVVVVAVDNRIHEQLVESNFGVILNRRVPEIGLPHGACAGNVSRELIKAAHDLKQVSVEAPLDQHVRCLALAFVTHVLNVGSGNEGLGSLPKSSMAPFVGAPSGWW